MPDHLPEGVYERLRTSDLDDLLAGAVRRALADESDPARRAALVNALLQQLQADGQQVREELEQLVRLQRPPGPAHPCSPAPALPCPTPP